MMIAKERITTENYHFVKSIELEPVSKENIHLGYVQLVHHEGQSVYDCVHPGEFVPDMEVNVEYCQFRAFRECEEFGDHIHEVVNYIAMPEKVAEIFNKPFKTIENQQKQIDYLRKDCNKFLDLSNSLINHVNGLAELSFWDRVLMVFKGVPRYTDAVGNKCDE